MKYGILGSGVNATLNRLLLIALLIACLAGCGPSSSSSKESSANIFRVPLDIPPTSLDPAFVSDVWSIDTMQNSFEGLVVTGEDNEVHPGLADKWDISTDGRVYTFHLKSGVKFHNGRELKAQDVKDSLERACSRELASPLAANYLNDIIGFEAIRKGESQSLAGVKVIDDHTVSITIDAARPYFLAKLTCSAASILAIEAIKDRVHITSIEELVGTGPFRITKYNEGQLLVQEAFNDYHRGRPKIDAISRPIMRDTTERLNAFKRGEIVIIQQLGRSDYIELSKDAEYAKMVKLIPKATLVYFALNAKTFPDRRVRQAIAMAIDRQVIADDYLYGTVTAAKGILPIGVPGHRNNPNWLAPNIERAKQLLKEAGHANGKGLPMVRIAFPMENPDIEKIADQIGAQLTEKLGLTIRLEKMETAAIIIRQNDKTLDSEVTGWTADYLDPQDFLSLLLTSTSQENHWHYRNGAFDSLCGAADKEGDAKRRLDLYAKAEDIVLQDAIYIPISYWATPVIISSKVQALKHNSAQFLPYNTVTLTR
jgi:oligopeptide transport system substrate-binding protein